MSIFIHITDCFLRTGSQKWSLLGQDMRVLRMLLLHCQAAFQKSRAALCHAVSPGVCEKECLFPLASPLPEREPRGCRGRKRKTASFLQTSELGLGLGIFLLGSEWVAAERAKTRLISALNGQGFGTCQRKRTASSRIIPWHWLCGFGLEILSGLMTSSARAWGSAGSL